MASGANRCVFHSGVFEGLDLVSQGFTLCYHMLFIMIMGYFLSLRFKYLANLHLVYHIFIHLRLKGRRLLDVRS